MVLCGWAISRSQLFKVDSTSGQKQLTIFASHYPHKKSHMIKSSLRPASTLQWKILLSIQMNFPIGLLSTGKKKDEHIGRFKLSLHTGIKTVSGFFLYM